MLELFYNFFIKLFLILLLFLVPASISYIPGFLLFFNYFRYLKTGKVISIIGRYLYDEDNPEEYAESRTRVPFALQRRDAGVISSGFGIFFTLFGLVITYILYWGEEFYFLWYVSTFSWFLFLIAFFYWYMKIKN